MFVEGLGAATYQNGVLRVELIYRNGRGEDVPAGELVLPGTRITAILKGLEALVEQIRLQDATGNA